LTKASLYVYFGPVALLVCRRFDHNPCAVTRILNKLLLELGLPVTSTT